MDAVSSGGWSDATRKLTATAAHIKNLLQAARQPATDGYTRIVQSLQKEGNVGLRTHKNASGAVAETTSQTTYLCLQCPNVSNSRERHRKDHAFGERRMLVRLATTQANV